MKAKALERQRAVRRAERAILKAVEVWMTDGGSDALQAIIDAALELRRVKAASR